MRTIDIKCIKAMEDLGWHIHSVDKYGRFVIQHSVGAGRRCAFRLDHDSYIQALLAIGDLFDPKAYINIHLAAKNSPLPLATRTAMLEKEAKKVQELLWVLAGTITARTTQAERNALAATGDEDPDSLLNELMWDALEEEDSDATGYDQGYQNGYHDALVEAMNAFGIEHNYSIRN